MKFRFVILGLLVSVSALADSQFVNMMPGGAVSGSYSFTAPLINTSGTVTCRTATGSVSGCLSAANWTTFNGKQAALGYTPMDAAGSVTATGDQNFGGKKIISARYNYALYDAGNSSTAITLNFNNGPQQKVTLTGSATFTFSNPVAGETIVLELLQDATGSRLVTWPAAVKWPSGTAPTLTTTASALDIVTLYYDGTNYYGASGLTFQ